MKKLRVIEAFAGVGSQRMALDRLGVNHEVVGIFEIDKFAIQSYEAIHGATHNFGDISAVNVNDIPDHDLFTYSFPCQDLSVAGRRQGMVRGKTRSGLLYECEKLIEAKRPKFLLLENVKNLVSKKFKPQFDEWLNYLESLGYTNYWAVLNAKDFGTCQNRERVFVVSILGEHEPFEFPIGQPCEVSLKDILEDEIEEKYYLSQQIQERFKSAPKLHTDIKILGTTAPEFKKIGQRDRVYSVEGICPALVETDYKQPKQLIAPHRDSRVAKLTPLEAWRVMDFSDEDFMKAKAIGMSDTQLYKQAGNSIAVNCLIRIFNNLLKEYM